MPGPSPRRPRDRSAGFGGRGGAERPRVGLALRAEALALDQVRQALPGARRLLADLARRAGEDEAVDAPGEVEGESLAHHAAARMPDDVRARLAEVVEKAGEIPREQGRIVRTRWLRRGAGAAQIPAKHPVVRGERVRVRGPEVERPAEPVRQDDQ